MPRAGPQLSNGGFGFKKNVPKKMDRPLFQIRASARISAKSSHTVPLLEIIQYAGFSVVIYCSKNGRAQEIHTLPNHI